MSLQKFKIKEQLGEIKSQYESQKTTIPAESRFLFSMMVQLMELLITVFEERFTKKTSSNSSTPPSKSREQRKKKTRKKSLKKRIQITDPPEINEPDEVVDLYPEFCGECGLEFNNGPSHYESRQIIDIVVERYVTEYRAHYRSCPCCKSEQRGKFPKGLVAPVQYGPMIKSLAIAMLFAQMSSYSRTQVMLMELVGKSLSLATIVGFVRSLHKKLEVWEEWAKKQLLAGAILHADETGYNLNGVNAWIHVLSNDNIVLMSAHAKRGKAAIDKIGVIPKYGGTLVHDFWPPYYQYDQLNHAACGAHLLRELEFIIEAHNHNWAKLMHKVLCDALELVNRRARGKLLNSEFKTITRRYRIAIAKGDKECPEPKSTGKKGRVAKTKSRNLLERFRDHETEILRFSIDSVVPFTNNIAERDIRMVKVKQNVSGFFRSEEGAQAFCRIRSYLLTQWRVGIPPIEALRSAIEGHINCE